MAVRNARLDNILEIECDRLEKGLFTFTDDEGISEYLTTESCEREEFDQTIEVETPNEDIDNLEEFIKQFESFLESSTDFSEEYTSNSVCESTKKELIPFYVQSSFPNIPPTLNFPHSHQQIETIPSTAKPYLIWKQCAITPNVVRTCVREAGFKYTAGDEWIGYYGKHMKARGFKSIAAFQKFNHFPGSFQLGRKDSLWRNVTKMQMKNARKEFAFLPQTYILPGEYEQFKFQWDSQLPGERWIKKPLASARGIGVELVQNFDDIPKDKPMIIQRYITNPLIINERKCDLRIYVYVTSFDPLRVYVYNDGVVRFATEKYTNSQDTLSNRFVHLTNYSVNKLNSNFHLTEDGKQAEGHKWTLQTFWRILREKGIDTNKIWESIKSLALKTIISVESPINSYVKNNLKFKDCVHELFGFDVLLDESYKPWLVEVNISPSLHSICEFDVSLKSPLVANLLTLAGYRLPHEQCHHVLLTSNERSKHAYFAKKASQKDISSKILATLTPDDVRMLIETEDEHNRCGNFERIFPAKCSEAYLRYFPAQRYYNLLLNAWYSGPYGKTDRGVKLLQALSEENIPFSRNPPKTHLWNLTSSSVFTTFKPLRHITNKKYRLSIFKQKRYTVTENSF